MIRRILLPVILVSAFIFLLAPVVVVVLAAFNTGAVMSFPPAGFTTRWFTLIKPTFIDALYVSLIVGISTALLSVLVGLPGALALARGRFWGRDLIGSFCLSPLMVPSLVTGVALFQASLLFWDFTRVTIGGTIPGLVIGHMAFCIPFVIRAVVAGHARFDPALEEAAQNFGASPVETFWRVTLPVLKPGIISGGIFAFVDTSFDDVPIALFMGGGSATTLPVQIFTSIEFDFGGDVMAVAALVVGASVVLMLVLDRLFGLDQFFGGAKV